jgi:hypothetical protein
MIQIEKLISSEIAKSNGLSLSALSLRFDRVAIRLLENIRVAIEQKIEEEITVIMTITAPIKLPAKTASQLIEKIKNFLEFGIPPKDSSITIFQNKVQLRFVKSSKKESSKFIGLVHNPDIKPQLLLDLATQWLTTTTNR